MHEVEVMIPVVDQETFDEIPCNRCGKCCEDFWLVDSDSRAAFPEGPIGELMWQLYWENISTPAHRADPQDGMLWFGQLTPRQDENGNWWYSCGHFYRDEEGVGVCGIHDERPEMCRNFPNGTPKHYGGCSYDVEIVNFEVVQ